MARYYGHVSVPYSTYDIFRNAVNGNWYDWDGFYGAQCWDGVQLLYGQVSFVYRAESACFRMLDGRKFSY